MLIYVCWNQRLTSFAKIQCVIHNNFVDGFPVNKWIIEFSKSIRKCVKRGQRGSSISAQIWPNSPMPGQITTSAGSWLRAYYLSSKVPFQSRNVTSPTADHYVKVASGLIIQMGLLRIKPAAAALLVRAFSRNLRFLALGLRNFLWTILRKSFQHIYTDCNYSQKSYYPKFWEVQFF